MLAILRHNTSLATFTVAHTAMKSRQTSTIRAIILLALGFQSGCTGVPDGTQAVTGFELDRYLGTWYEIARLDHRFERGMTNVTANYSMRDDGGVSVVNRGYKVEEGEWNDAAGKAYFVGDVDVGQLKVSFFGPFYGGYNIIELDKDNYQYALVAGPDRDYLWILARSPSLNEGVLSNLVRKATYLNFPTDELIYVDHTAP
jgi:apolipoprotein D and lipocalin family protein